MLRRNTWFKQAGCSLLSSSTYPCTAAFAKSNLDFRAKPGGHAGKMLGDNRDKGRLGKDMLWASKMRKTYWIVPALCGQVLGEVGM